MSTQTNQNPKQKRLSPEALALRREERRNVFLAALVVALLVLLFALLSLFAGDREYSENENRYLQGRPHVSLAAIADGTFMEETEAYLSDQFFGRDFLVQTRSKIDLFEGKRDVNDVYVGDDHFLFEKPSVWDKARMDKTLGAMNRLTSTVSASGIRSYFALAPNATELLPDYLPANAPRTDQAAQIERIYDALPTVRGIDLTSPLKAVKDPSTLYYKTDHHWTAFAAEPAFLEIADAMGLDTNGFRYKQFPLTNDFQGTLASTSGLFRTSDTIFASVPETGIEYVVEYVKEGKKTTSVFDTSKLKQKDKYEVFFGGNFGEILIRTNAASDRTLLVLKDSYANSVLPLFLPYFKTIVVVDPRYYNDNITDLIGQEGVTDLLWFYNVNTFLNDTSIATKFS